MAGSKTSFARGQLKSIVERIERLEEEKKTIAGDIKEVYAEAMASTRRSCARSSACARRKPPSAPRSSRCSTFTWQRLA
jgi:uncharacterized protein (UPF0335 family)